jgi:lipoate-protein ligase A
MGSSQRNLWPFIVSQQLQLAKRPTGGGIIFHITDFAFSLLMPANHPHFSKNTLENYAYVNGLVTRLLSSMMVTSIPRLLGQDEKNDSSPSFCMANPTVYDVMVDGKKVGGAAQRCTKHGYLHQGSIFLAMPEDSFFEAVLLDKSVLLGMKANSFPLLGVNACPKEIQEAKQHIKNKFKEVLLKIWSDSIY